MIIIRKTYDGYWLKIGCGPRVFYGDRAGVERSIEKLWWLIT